MSREMWENRGHAAKITAAAKAAGCTRSVLFDVMAALVAGWKS